MSEQGALFDVVEASPVVTVRSPLCLYKPHCGGRAVIGPAIVTARCVNQTITCLTCGAEGVRSAAK